jgi:hypothetical protein
MRDQKRRRRCDLDRDIGNLAIGVVAQFDAANDGDPILVKCRVDSADDISG